MLMPMRQDVNPISGNLGPRIPKYDVPGNWSGMDFGFRPVYLLAADLTTAQLNALTANADVKVFPATLDNNVGAANLATVRANLELYNFPGNWIVAATLYRSILRVLIGACQIATKFHELRAEVDEDPDLFPAGVTLGTAYSDMPSPYRERLLEAIDAIPYNRDALTGASTMRDLVRSVGQQSAPIAFLGVTV